MSIEEQFSNKNWPKWLEAIAIRINELVMEPQAMTRFRFMLRDWKVEHDAHGPSSPVDKRGYIQYNPVEFLPRRRITMPEKYARLAAIHDVICEITKRIDPWYTHRDLRRAPHRIAGISYSVLLACVRELGDGDRDRIKAALREVEADLAEKVPSVEKLIKHALDTPKPGDGKEATHSDDFTKTAESGLPEPGDGIKTKGQIQRETTAEDSTIDRDSHLTPKKLSEVFDVPLGSLRARLNRWRKTSYDGWIENSDRKPRESKYIYRVESVHHIIDALKANS